MENSTDIWIWNQLLNEDYIIKIYLICCIYATQPYFRSINLSNLAFSSSEIKNNISGDNGIPLIPQFMTLV